MTRLQLLKLAFVIGLVGFLSVVQAVDLADDLTWSGDGPGLTFDEDLNVVGGVYIVESALSTGLGILHPAVWSEIFNSPNYHPDYPPLGRMPAALSNALLMRMIDHQPDEIYRISYGRVGSAVAFGLLTALVFGYVASRTSLAAGLIAATTLILTPRVFGHAHLASVETMMNLTYTLCLIGTAVSLSSRRRLTWKQAIIPGCLLGIALLTKIQAIFLPPLIVIWILTIWFRNGFLPIVTIAITSWCVLLLGWPWLWTAPLQRTLSYFLQGNGRAVLNCSYLGERYPDHLVPWHYPWVMVLTTTPIVILLLGLLGIAGLVWKLLRASRSSHTPETGSIQITLKEKVSPQSRLGPSLSHSGLPQESILETILVREQLLLLGGILLPLIVFSLPNVAVYDGERLFLVIWPLLSIFCGFGADLILTQTWARTPALKYGFLATGVVFTAIGIWNLRTSLPDSISSYSLAIAGNQGAEKQGMETTYWGEAISPEFLRRSLELIPEGATVGIAPVLHPAYLQGMKQQSWLRHRPDLQIMAYDDQAVLVPDYVYFSIRKADPWESLMNPPAGTKVLDEAITRGVVGARLIQRPQTPEAE